MPLVSVIMNCYNCSKYLREALDSVFQQTFKDYEIIFWDNRSTDNSAEIALNYGEPLRYFKGETFLPLGAARNKAVEQARGKYIALLDCDDVWLPEKLERQVTLFEGNPSLALVYSDCYIIDEIGNINKKTAFDICKPYSEDIFFNLLSKYNFIPCPTAMFKKEVFEKIGGFRSDLTFSEEFDLFLRIAYEYEISYVSTPLAKYRQHESNFTSINWMENFWEHIYVVENIIDTLESFSESHVKAIKRSLIIWYAGILLKHFRNKKYFRILILFFKLLKKHIIISAKLKKKVL